MKIRLKSALVPLLCGLATANLAPAQVLIDFGPNNVLDGNITASPDLNGNYWNNMTAVTNGSSITNLVTTNNSPSTIAITLTSSTWLENGIRNGGLLSPNPSLLGIFAVTNATQDYFYIQTAGTTATLQLGGLNPALAYNLTMFATRTTSSTDTRNSIYTVTDVNGTHSVTLQTSGTGAGSAANPYGNDKTNVVLTAVVPNGSGQINLTLSIGANTGSAFAYIGAMEIAPAKSAPTFTVNPFSQTDRVGTTNTLTALAAGSQSISYQWYFANTNLPTSYIPVSGATGTNLVLANVGYTNAGSYYLVASNSVGVSTSAVAQVSIVPVHIPGQAVLVDFGPNDGVNGNITTSPDANGNYWNNMVSGPTVANGLSITNLVTANNTANPLAVTVTSTTWLDNGIQNGGLTNPTNALLGDFAIATATEDYFHLQGAGVMGTLRISGLNPLRSYNFSMFGTRNTSDIRNSIYSVTDVNGTHTVTLQTSGAGVNSGLNPTDTAGNDKTIVSLNRLVPDALGQIDLTVTVGAYTGSAFAYLGALEINYDNHPPVANNQSYSRNGLNSWKIKVTDLLTNATDVDGDALSLAGVGTSTNGVSLTISGGYVQYNNANLAGDQFSYTVTDAFGGTNSAVITLTVGSSNGVSGQVSNIAFVGGTPSMTFAGIPGYLYHVQVSTNISIPSGWTTIHSTNAPAGGVFFFQDNSPPSPQAYYRLMWSGN